MLNNESKPPERVLIVLLGAIGDVARGLALVDPIKAAWSKTHLTWLVEPKSEAIVRLHDRVDEVLVFERSKGGTALLKTARQVRALKFDLVLDLQRHFKSGFFSWSSRAKRRIGFNPKDAKEFNWWFNTEHVKEFGEAVPKIDNYLGFLDHIGISHKEPHSFGIDRRVRTITTENTKKLPADPFAFLVLGSSWASKDWFPQGYAGLIKSLRAKNLKVVLLGDRSKAELGQKLVGSFDGVISLAGETTLTEVAAVILRSKIGIGPDSGPGHIAGALGIPYVSLFGATDPVRTAPYGGEDLTVQSAIGCSPCYRRECPGLGRLCMRLISVESVMGKVEQVLG